MSISDNLAKINQQFYEWAKKILTLTPHRTLQLNTYLINLFIAQNYFRWFQELFNQFPWIVPSTISPEQSKEFSIALEIIHGIFIQIPMIYQQPEILSINETDNQINDLGLEGPLVRTFFAANLIPEDVNIEVILDQFKGFYLKEHLIPDLSFDPLFQIVLQSNAFSYLYDTSFIKDIKEDKDPKRTGYFPHHSFLAELAKAREYPIKILFNIASELRISKFFQKDVNFFGVMFLGSFYQIDDIIQLFTEYFSIRVPSQKENIYNYLPCFAEMLKLSRGRLYIKLRRGKILKKLAGSLPKSVVSRFMCEFVMEKGKSQFPTSFHEFNAHEFIDQYHNFLKFLAYEHSGFIYTGVFLIWRALIKYLEALQNVDDFKKFKKGALLEKWAYEKAVEYGFQARKLILRNQDLNPSEIYFKMKEQTKDFPGPIFEKQVEFPREYRSTFEEIDLAIRASDYLFLFECKGTSAPLGQQGEIFKWVQNFQENITRLIRKGDILFHNLNNHTIIDDFFQGLRGYIPIILQTEGIFLPQFSVSTEGYLRFLEELQKRVKNGSLHEIIHFRE